MHNARMSEVTLIRQGLGLNQTAFAKLIGVSQGTVSKWENGKEDPTPLHLEGIRAIAAKTKPAAPQGASVGEAA